MSLDEQYEAMKADKRRVNAIGRRLDKLAGETVRLEKERAALIAKWEAPEGGAE